MKKIYLLLLLVAGFADAQIVNIPDAIFKARLLESSSTSNVAYSGGAMVKIDANDDGQIQLAESAVIDSLHVGNFLGLPETTISDLTGIESFVNLKKLDCSRNNITSLNTASLTGLQQLDCSYTMLTALDVSMMPNLQILVCYIAPIANLNISNLSNLQLLHCAYNEITSLDLSTVPNLKTLYCYANSLSTLDLSNCPLLQYLDCTGDNLTLLNVDGLSQLEYLDCNTNFLGSLSLNGLGALASLRVDNNQLTALDLSDLTSLQYLTCNDNQITALDFTGLELFSELGCYNNLLTTLDLSGNPLFSSIYCSNNNLTYVNIKNGYNTTNPDCQFLQNPNLSFICVDDGESAIMHQILVNSGLLNVNFNSYCSFLSGGDYNTIEGTLLFDANNNGCDSGDFQNPYLRVDINDGTATSSTFTNAAGNYAFFTQSGNFTLTPAIENPSFFTFAPTSAVVNSPVVDNSVTVQNFCMTANGNHPDVEVVLWANAIRPGFSSHQYVTIRNKGNQSLSGTVQYNFDDSLLEFVSAQPAVSNQALGLLSWNYSNLQPFETRNISLELLANTPTQTPPLNAGDVLAFSVSVDPISGDAHPDDNTFDTHVTAGNSYDPNQKTCLQGSSVLSENIGKYLHYNIAFENIGSEDAVNIVVKDTINTAQFDISSFQLLYASHPVKTKITGNVVEFIFEGINLPPSIMNPIGGHGNVLFKIKTLPTLTVGDEVSNTANIYFDYNAPIDTNEARTAFNNLSKSDFVKDDSVMVYPNPAKNKVTVKATGTIKSLQLYDVQGRILQSISDSRSQVTLDIANQQRGVYFLKITTDKGSAVQKIVKE